MYAFLHALATDDGWCLPAISKTKQKCVEQLDVSFKYELLAIKTECRRECNQEE